MSGITRSTPSNSDSGNIIPASTTKISSLNRNAIMFIPNSPSPPRGITVSDCLLLLKKGFSPRSNSKSYHTAPPPAPAALTTLSCRGGFTPPSWVLEFLLWRGHSCLLRAQPKGRRSSLRLSSRPEWPAFSCAPLFGAPATERRDRGNQPSPRTFSPCPLRSDLCPLCLNSFLDFHFLFSFPSS